MAFLVMATCDGDSTTTTAVGGSRMAGLLRLSVAATDPSATASRHSHR